MLSKDWKPSGMSDTEDRAFDLVKISQDGYVDAHDAERYMVVYQSLSEEWAEHYANATYYKENMRFKRDSAYNLAFMKSEARSDKGKDIDAKNDPGVRVGDIMLSEAVALLKLAELRYDGAVRSYHSMKRVCEMAHDEKKWL